MKPSLTFFNLLGVICLGCVCVVQWQTNRRLNLQELDEAKAREELMAKLEEQSGVARGAQADMDRFRDQLGRTSAALKDRDDQLVRLRKERAAWLSERDSLKSNTVAWVEAVAARDARLQEAYAAIESVTRERDERIHAFNRLATNHNIIVKKLDEVLRASAQTRTNRSAF